MHRNRRKFKKQKFVKIRVFQVDDRNRKGKRVAELRKNIESSTWHRLTLPVYLVSSLSKTQNGTLKLRVRCKKCNANIKLIMPGENNIKCEKIKTRKTKTETNVRGNSSTQDDKAVSKQRRETTPEKNSTCEEKNRIPFMVIEKKEKTDTSSRYKRSTRSSTENLTTGSCGDPMLNQVCCVRAIPVQPGDLGMEDTLVAPSTLLATTCDGTCEAQQHVNIWQRRNRGERRGSKRRKHQKFLCKPIDSQPLEVWFFNRNQDLMHISLPGLTVSECGCQAQ